MNDFYLYTTKLVEWCYFEKQCCAVDNMLAFVRQLYSFRHYTDIQTSTDLKINMEYISGNAFTYMYTQTLKIQNGYIAYTKVLQIIFVIYVKYLNSIHYHVFDILWHSCKLLIRCNKIW